MSARATGVALCVLGLAQMAGDALGVDALRGLAAATTAYLQWRDPVIPLVIIAPLILPGWGITLLVAVGLSGLVIQAGIRGNRPYGAGGSEEATPTGSPTG